MSKTTSKYPKDEFDQVDPNALPAGVHRTPPSRWSVVLPYIVVAIVCAALAVAAIYFVAKSPNSPISNNPSVTATATPEGTESAEPTAESTEPTGEATDPAPETTPEPTEPTTSEPPAAPVDLQTAVRVLNATGRSGVAGDAADLLKAAGWTDVTADTFADSTKPKTSVVYYKDAANEAAAREVAKVLGITEVESVSTLRAPISAVLVGDYGK